MMRSDGGTSLLSRRSFLKGMMLAALFSALPLSPDGLFGPPASAAPADVLKGPGDGSGRRPLVLRVTAPVIRDEGFSASRYLDHIDGEMLGEMVAAGITGVAGVKDLRTAWLNLLKGYRKGDRFAIKPNFNFVNHGFKYTITAPGLIDAVVAQLVDVVGSSPSDIYVYDLCKLIPGGLVRERIRYPVNYVERIDTSSLTGKVKLRAGYGLASADPATVLRMRERVTGSDGSPVACYMPKVVTNAAHIINMPLMTNHTYVASSGALKNHYGTVRFSDLQQYPEALHGEVMARSIADINKSYHIAQKTRVIIADALFGVFDRGEGEGKRPWKTFGGRFPESIFVSTDPVAVDSVMASFVLRERKARGLENLSYEYLKEAERAGLGAFEMAEDIKAFRKIDYMETAPRKDALG